MACVYFQAKFSNLAKLFVHTSIWWLKMQIFQKFSWLTTLSRIVAFILRGSFGTDRGRCIDMDMHVFGRALAKG